jgi:hypothetical protein
MFLVRESINFRASLPAIFVQSLGATSVNDDDLKKTARKNQAHFYSARNPS